MEERSEDPRLRELKAEITTRLKAFLSKQERGSQISIFRVSRRTGFDPFYVRQILAGKSVPFKDVCDVLQALGCPSVFVEEFVCDIKEFSDQYKRIHGIEQTLPNFLLENPAHN
jgi:hypothetical protein